MFLESKVRISSPKHFDQLGQFNSITDVSLTTLPVK